MARKRKKKKSDFGGWKYFTLLAVVLLICGAGAYFYQKHRETQEIAESKPVEQRVIELMRENPDAEVFRDGLNASTKKKSP